MRTSAQRAWSFYLRSCSARMCSKNNLLINSTAVNVRGHSFLISMNVYTVMKKVTWLQISTKTIGCEQHFLQPSAPIGFLRGTYISLWLATNLLTTRPHGLGGFYPMCWNSGLCGQLGNRSREQWFGVCEGNGLMKVAWSSPHASSFKSLIPFMSYAFAATTAPSSPDPPSYCCLCKLSCLFLLYAVTSPDFCQRLLA